MYGRLFEAYLYAYRGEFSMEKIEANINALWKNLYKDKRSFPENLENKIRELNVRQATNRHMRLEYEIRFPGYNWR